MASDPKRPKYGEPAIDISDLPVKGMTAEQVKKATKLRPGALAALQRVLQLKPPQREAAGISPTEITRGGALLSDYTYAAELEPPAEKIAELVHETKIDRGHQIAALLTEVAGQVRHRAERGLLDPEVLAALEELFDYQYGPAYKGQLTKAKNAKNGANQPAPGKPAPDKPSSGTPATETPAPSKSAL
jgi:hypothetical protein